MSKHYKPRQELRPRALEGISEDQIAQHWALYEGYVKNANALEEKAALLSKKGDFGAEFSELKRRAGFEWNGVILHEHYFGVLKSGQPGLKAGSELALKIEEDFGSYREWKSQFISMGHMRGTGWVILYYDARRDKLVNAWISSHEVGHFAGCAPVLVMDVWEHAYMVDWGADGRPRYIDKFLLNVDWSVAEEAFLRARRSELVLEYGD